MQQAQRRTATRAEAVAIPLVLMALVVIVELARLTA
jgi:hypothetical protein